MLTDAGMKEGKDYTFLPVGDGGMAAAAFLRGDIEAYAASIRPMPQSFRGGVIPLRDITPEKYLTSSGMALSPWRSYIKENPDVIKGFGRAMVRGTKFGLIRPTGSKVLQYCKKGNPQEGEDIHLSQRGVGYDHRPDDSVGYVERLGLQPAGGLEVLA